jgi:predicted anti-sigma-YlaC factor YlaD
MTANELTCQELVELVTDYLEMALPEAEMARFEAHLAGCRGCRHYLDQMRTTIRLVGRLREDDLSPMARDELLAVFRSWKQRANGA